MKTVEGKVVVLGSHGVGKTSLIIRYAQNLLIDHATPTIGASFFSCKMNIEDTRVKLQVWDTAGQERFRSMAPMYYRNANAALLVFDVTQYNTFTAIKTWINELKRNIEEPLVLVVVGNKCDLVGKRTVDPEEGRKYATRIGASYHETSVLYDEGIEKVFLTTALGLLRMVQRWLLLRGCQHGGEFSTSLCCSCLEYMLLCCFGNRTSPGPGRCPWAMQSTVRLSNGNNHDSTSLKIQDSPSSGFGSSDSEYPLTPSSEESLANTSIAYGIHEKPPACC